MLMNEQVRLTQTFRVPSAVPRDKRVSAMCEIGHVPEPVMGGHIGLHVS
jgi:hypothetical protein